MIEAHHLSELEITASLLPGAPRPTCAVPGCVACAARLDEAHGAAREFHDRMPQTLAQVRARMARHAPAPWWRGWTGRLLAGPLAVAAAVAIAFALWPGQRTEPSGGGPDLRAKGSREDVRVFVRRGDAVHRLAELGAVQPGDALRFVVDPHGARFVLIMSIDGARRISTYYPFDGSASAALPARAGQVELDGSVVLDDTIGDERIWVLLSDEPVAVDRVRPELARLAEQGVVAAQAADDGAVTAGLPGVRAVSVRLHKVASPMGSAGSAIGRP